jgi:hypothetical protein
MLSHDDVRRIALALPEAIEQDHHGRASFRVATKIFATLPDADHVNVMLEPDDILLACQHESGACAPGYWGKKLSALTVDLRRIPAELLAELLRDAWARRAPKRLHPLATRGRGTP